MKFNAKQVSISVLSPLHLGCGEDYAPTNFVIDENLLHLLDSSDLASSLTAEERQQLIKASLHDDPVGTLQRFFKERRNRFAPLASHCVAVADEIAAKYETEAGMPTQRGRNGATVYNTYSIARTAYRAIDNAPFLPGSALKGAIRTAWLNQVNRGKPATEEETRDAKNGSRKMQARVLGYRIGNFEDDPLRHAAIGDAHTADCNLPLPTRVLYSVSKKKYETERGCPEIRVFLEVIEGLLPSALRTDLRLTGDTITWDKLCDACNDFYWPQLQLELDHAHLGKFIDPAWRKAITALLNEPLHQLRQARQGFLLRVGKHSGAESVTIDGMRRIKILGKAGSPPNFKPVTNEKRFASLTKNANAPLRPFGWIWVESCSPEFQYLSIEVQRILHAGSAALTDAHRERRLALEDAKRQRAAALSDRRNQEAAQRAAEQEEQAAEAARAAQRALLSENMRKIIEFKDHCESRQAQLRGKKEKPNTETHHRARVLAQEAATDGWTAEEKMAAADAIEQGLPTVVAIDAKEIRKQLKLAALRGQ